MQLISSLQRVSRLALPPLALAGAAWLLAPAETALGFSTLGGSLSAESQRDFRVFNNFLDATANNNDDDDPSFPGWDGAELALWKGAMEWGSGPHGDGTGDPLHAVIGDGGANFDFYWAGSATGVGSSNNNIISGINSCSGGVLAFVETPISDGWRMRFCETASAWSDGPGAPTTGEGGNDLQGVGSHEFGHALGLGHSAVGTAVMAPSTANGLSQRNLDPDDAAGVQFIYGVKSASKPVITAAFVDLGTNTVTIDGTNFSTTGNEVRFTNLSATSTGSDPLLRVTNVSSTGGGTEIVVSIPSGAFSGDVMVKQSGTGHATLSNAWPVDLENGGGSGTDPDAKFTATNTVGGTPLTVAFSDLSTGTGINTWDWDFGDGNTSSLASPSHTYTQAGTFDVTLTVTGSNGTDFLTQADFVTALEGASCTVRLGSGANPNIFACANDPILGTTWIASVSAGGIGGSGLSTLIGYGAALPAPFPTTFGELLIDPSTGIFVGNTAPIVNGIAAHFVALPNDTTLSGLDMFTQVFVGGAGQLTNGLDLELGF